MNKTPNGAVAAQEKIKPDFGFKDDKIGCKELAVAIGDAFEENEGSSLAPTIAVLNSIMNELPTFKKLNDWKEALDKTDDDKFKTNNKVFLVAVVDEILKVTKKNKYSVCEKNEDIYIYNGSYWGKIKDREFKNFLGDCARKIGVDKVEAKYHLFKDNLHKQFLASASLKHVKNKNRIVSINLTNGTFDISAKKTDLREYRKEDFLTHQLPFAYEADATAPRFKKYLDEVLPDENLQNILAEFIGAVFVKNDVLKIEKVLLLYGKGANGKSVFFEIIMALLGYENISNYSLKSLTNESGYERANIADKLLNYSSEISGSLQSDAFKLLASQEPIEAKVKYKDPFIMSGYARLMFNCNELPKDVENTVAFFRRFIIIPFNVTIAESDQDKDLSNKIISDELSGVFNWMLSGLARLLKNRGFTKSDVAEKEVAEFKKQSNSVALFIEEEGYVRSINEKVYRTELYPAYRDYCNNAGNKPLKQNNFVNRMEDLGFIYDRDSRSRFFFMKRE